ncbi:MAG: phosphate ABC transporter ATP-binding protein [Pseudomonadota bacterium]
MSLESNYQSARQSGAQRFAQFVAAQGAVVKEGAAPPPRPKLAARGVSLWYGAKQALHDVELAAPEGRVTAFIGPSGCGKTTMLRCFNRMHEHEETTRLGGSVLMRGETGRMEDVYAEDIDPPMHRRRFGWVAQKPDPFPDTIYSNLAYPPHLHGRIEYGPEMDAHVERLLRRAGLWEELKDRLDAQATDLSIGQQQRLCIARALSCDPEVLLMDEPCGSLDPISTQAIEELVLALKGSVTIILITHNMEQAARIADYVAFFHLGRIRAFGSSASIFGDPQDKQLKSYLAGRFG